MSKTTKEYHSKLLSKKGSLQALRSLYTQLRVRKEEMSTYIRGIKKGKPNSFLVNQMNQLKYHSNRIKMIYQDITAADEQRWEQIKERSQMIYKKAKTFLSTKSYSRG